MRTSKNYTKPHSESSRNEANKRVLIVGTCLVYFDGTMPKPVRLSSGRIKYGQYTFAGYNKPRNSPKKGKTKMVLAKKGDQVRLIHFGDPNLKIKKNIPARKRSYCARSGGIKGANDKLSANYWSRRAWDC